MAYDVAIAGGGVMGLWAARHAIKRGQNVVLIEKRGVGSGASGGFLGALMPHMPDTWNEKKQFQFEGLDSLPHAVSELEADTGMSCGYRRCGRIMPVTNETLLQQVEKRSLGAADNWGETYTLSQLDGSKFDQWLSPSLASHGVQYDTLAARINPRQYVAALGTYVRDHVTTIEGDGVAALQDSSFTLESGERVSAGQLIVANGWEAYPLLQKFFDELNDGKSVGRGVKGQAVLVEYKHEDDLSIVYHDGAYVVPHENNRIAIGSTSVNDWTGEPNSFDPDDMAFYEKAIELVPALKDAPIVGCWAGVRPRNTLKARGTSPWFGPVPEHESIVALVGGFKITLGISHLDFVSKPFVM